jgi:hypothetical protein
MDETKRVIVFKTTYFEVVVSHGYFDVLTYEGYPATVCCADELPAHVGVRPRTFIVNTDTCDRGGSHWVAFHFPLVGPAEFFDSLGNVAETYHRRFTYNVKTQILKCCPRFLLNQRWKSLSLCPAAPFLDVSV